MKIVLAGAESNEALKVFQSIRPPAVLLTQMYLQKKSEAKVRELLEAYKEMGCWIIIDSGAFTFLSKYAVIRTDTTIEEFRANYNLHRFAIEDWQLDPEEARRRFDDEFDKYFHKWLKSLDLYYEYADMIAELDIDVLVGMEKMWELRSEYDQYKDKICYTPHFGMEKPIEERTSEEHSYLHEVLNYGITYFGIGNIPYKIIENFFITYKEVKDKKIKVHGWAQTNWESIQRLPYFSIDSSVDGNSKVLVRYNSTNPTVPYKIEHLTIEELYNREIKKEFRTSTVETRVPYKNIEVLTVNENNDTVWGNLYGVVKHKVKKPTIKLKIQGGKEVICTTDHSIITMDSDGNLIETKADGLKVGDYVLSTKTDSAFKENKGKKSLYTKYRTFKMTDNALQMYGLWIGDGFLYDYAIGFSCLGDEECEAPIRSFMNRHGVKIHRKKTNNVDGIAHSVKLVKRFKELGLVGKSHEKRIPSWVFTLNERQICQILKGYFSADGSYPCTAFTTSEQLKDDVVCLLEMMGIYVSVSCRKAHTFEANGKTYNARTGWTLTVRDVTSLIKFRDKIGFLQKYKMDKLNEFINERVTRQSRREEIPKYIKNKNKANGVTFLKIRGIEEISDGTEEVEVYDLSVEKYERFFANGVLVHNTTWLSANKFGVTFEYKDGWTRMKSHDHTQKDLFRNTCEVECREANIDFENFKNDMNFESLQWSALQWVRMAEYYDKDISRAYWLTEEEVGNAIEERREESGINNLVVRETKAVSVFEDERLNINRMCNSCEIADKCTAFQAGATCAFQTSGLSKGLTSKDLMKAVIDLQLGRVNQAVFSERVKGGSVDGNVTKEMQVLSRMIKEYDFMNQDGTGIHITAKGEESVGVLERIFGGGGEKKPATVINAVEADYEEVKDE